MVTGKMKKPARKSMARKKRGPPSKNGANGRSPTTGRFLPGNPGGPGNPHVRQTAQLRAELLAAVTPADVKAIAKRLVKMAKAGNMAAIRELFDRLLGKAVQAIEIDAETKPPVEWDLSCLSKEELLTLESIVDKLNTADARNP